MKKSQDSKRDLKQDSKAAALQGKAPETDGVAALKSVLEHAGLKVTKQRLVVLSLLSKIALPISADEILARLPRGSADKATVYRILNQMAAAGIAREIHFRDGIVRFEVCGCCEAHDDGDHHDHAHEHDDHCHHVVCKSCGVVDHVESGEVEAALKKISKQIKGFSVVDEHTLEFFGTCTDCAAMTVRAPKVAKKK